MPYTTHGHWYGPGNPTQPGPRLIAKCFGLGGCYDCRTQAGLPPHPEPATAPATPIKPTEEAYPGWLAALVSMTKPLLLGTEELDLTEMRSICERFQALGPVLEPTAYMRGGGMNLADQAAFLKAVDEFVTALRKLDRRTESEAATHG